MQIGAGWIKKTKEGENYLSCYIEFFQFKLYFKLFKNKPKEGETLHENAPQYRIVTFLENKDNEN